VNTPAGTIPNGAWCLVFWDWLLGKLFAIPAAPPRTIYGTLASSLSAGGSTSVTVTKTLNGSSPGGITVYSPTGYAGMIGSSGDFFRATENLADGKFYFDIILTAVSNVVDIQYDLTAKEFQKKTQSQFVPTSAAASGWTTIIALDACM
jgi:hypothetical protein